MLSQLPKKLFRPKVPHLWRGYLHVRRCLLAPWVYEDFGLSVLNPAAVE